MSAPETSGPSNNGGGLNAAERRALMEIAKDGMDARGMLLMWLLSRSDGEDPARTARMLIDDIEDSGDSDLAGSTLVSLLREVADLGPAQLEAMPRKRRGGRAARLKERDKPQ